MPRHAKRTDENQKAIVTELRSYGFIVKVVSNLGGGMPDILVAKDKRAIGVEIKDTGKRKQVTDAEIEMRVWWEQLGMKYIIAENAGEIVTEWNKMVKEKK